MAPKTKKQAREDANAATTLAAAAAAVPRVRGLDRDDIADALDGAADTILGHQPTTPTRQSPDVPNLLDACAALDAESSVEGKLGTSLIRHLLDGRDLTEYDDLDVPDQYRSRNDQLHQP